MYITPFVCHSSITVVQSYFVYWAGIESRVVHDGSRSPCCGHNTTEMDGRNSNFVQQEDGVTTLPGTLFNDELIYQMSCSLSIHLPEVLWMLCLVVAQLSESMEHQTN